MKHCYRCGSAEKLEPSLSVETLGNEMPIDRARMVIRISFTHGPDWYRFCDENDNAQLCRACWMEIGRILGAAAQEWLVSGKVTK